jgi:hypothetical protein
VPTCILLAEELDLIFAGLSPLVSIINMSLNDENTPAV